MQELHLMKSLRDLLKAQRMTYKDLALAMEVSEPTVKRWFSSGGVSVEKLLRICEVLDIPLEKLALRSHRKESPETYEITPQEDQILYNNRPLFAYLMHLYHLESIPKMRRKFPLTEAKHLKFLREIEKMGFIQLLPGDRFHFLKGRVLRFSRKGLLSQEQARYTRQDFMDSSFLGTDEFLDISQSNLHREDIEVLRTELRKIINKAQALHQNDSVTNTKEVGLMVGLRPWRWGYMDSLAALLK